MSSSQLSHLERWFYQLLQTKHTPVLFRAWEGKLRMLGFWYSKQCHPSVSAISVLNFASFQMDRIFVGWNTIRDWVSWQYALPHSHLLCWGPDGICDQQVPPRHRAAACQSRHSVRGFKKPLLTRCPALISTTCWICPPSLASRQGPAPVLSFWPFWRSQMRRQL